VHDNNWYLLTMNYLQTRQFLRGYVDKTFNESSMVSRTRNRIYDNEHYTDETAPFRAPEWTLSGYNGSLKKYVDDYCKDWYPEIRQPMNQPHQAGDDDNRQEGSDDNNNDTNEGSLDGV